MGEVLDKESWDKFVKWCEEMSSKLPEPPTYVINQWEYDALLKAGYTDFLKHCVISKYIEE